MVTSPVVAVRSGEAAADLVNMCVLRLYDFWWTFQRTLLERLGLLYYPARKPAGQPIHHELEGREKFIQHTAPQPEELSFGTWWGHFVHELGTATFGALVALGSGVCWMASTATTTTDR